MNKRSSSSGKPGFKRDDRKSGNDREDKPFRPRADKGRGDSPRAYGERDKPKTFGSKSRDGGDSGGDRPFKRPFKRDFDKDRGRGDGPARSFGDRDKPKRFGDRREGPGDAGGDRPFKRPFKRDFDKDRSSGDRPPRPFGDRDKPKRFEDRGRDAGGDRPFKKPFKRDFDKDRVREDSPRPFADRDKPKSFPGKREDTGGADATADRPFKKPFKKDFDKDRKRGDNPRQFGDRDKPKKFGDKVKGFDDDAPDRPFKRSFKENRHFVKKRDSVEKKGETNEVPEPEFDKLKDRPKRVDKSKTAFKTPHKYKKAEPEVATETSKRKRKYSEDEATEEQEEGLMTLNKYISHSGQCSRREAAELVKQGKVKVNGELVTDPGYRVNEADLVSLLGKKLNPIKHKTYILLNKPKGYITTTDDEQGRDTVMDLVTDTGADRLFPIGRLDRNTTGLLLMTNDGDLAQKLAHPSYEIKKVYQVTLDKPITKPDFEKVVQGVTLEDGVAKVDELAYLEEKNELGLEIHSGKNRIVRRIFESLGYEVEKLDRVMYAGLTKKNIPRGKWRHLEEKEVIMLKHFKS